MTKTRSWISMGCTIILGMGCSESPSGKGTRTDFFSICPDGTHQLEGRAPGNAVEPDCDYEGALACESFGLPLSDHLGIANADAVAIQTCLASDNGSAIARRGGDAATIRVPIPKLNEGRLYVRGNYYVPSEVELPERASLLAIRPGAPYDVEQVSLRLNQDRSLTLQTGFGTVLGQSDAGAFEKGDWQCIEGSFEIGRPGAVFASLNGEVILSGDDVTVPSDSYSVAAAFGEVRGSSEAFEIVLDSFVVATSPIGCE